MGHKAKVIYVSIDNLGMKANVVNYCATQISIYPQMEENKKLRLIGAAHIYENLSSGIYY